MNIQTNIWALCFGLLLCGSLLIAPSPFVFATTNFKVGWDPNSEADLDGYGVYVRKGSPGPPYQHVDDVFLDELADPDFPQVTVAEVEDGTHYIVATAFDTAGNESDYSDSLCVKVSGGSVSECSSKDAGGGGGGGWLITSTGNQFRFSKVIGLIGLTVLIGLIGKKEEGERIKMMGSFWIRYNSLLPLLTVARLTSGIIGWWFGSGGGVMPYDTTSDDVYWTSNNTFTSAPSAGSAVMFNPSLSGVHTRDYSVEAVYMPSSVHEPSTMLLFGTGLVGLLGFGRKKFFKK